MARAVTALLLTLLALLPAGASPAGEGRALARGTVLTDGGGPATTVTVKLEISDMRIRREFAWEEALTDAQGAFEIDLSEYHEVPVLGLQFTTWSRDFTEAIRIEVVKQEDLPIEVELTVARGSVARGRVTDPDGAAIEGATVGTWGVREAKTDADGEYELVGLPGIGGTSIRANMEGYADGFADFRSDEPGIIEDLDITLMPAGKLTGLVLDPAGAPLGAGVAVLRKEKMYRREKIGEDGRFQFTGVPSGFKDVLLEVYSGKYPVLNHAFTDEERAAGHVEVQLKWPLSIVGTVTNPDGSPAPGATVVVGDGVSARPQRFRADKSGEFTAEPFEPGEELVLTVLAVDPSGFNFMGDLEFRAQLGPRQWRATVDPWPDGYTSEFTVDIGEDGSVSMTRTDEGPGAFPGKVLYRGKVEQGGAMMSGTLEIPAIGAEGKFQMRAYDPARPMEGAWDFREQIGEGRPLAAPAQLRLKGAPFPGRQHVKLSLGPPRTITGMVVNEDGTGIKDGTVVVQRWNRTRLFLREARVEPDGSFTLAGVPAGILEVIVRNELGQTIAGPAYIMGERPTTTLTTGRTAWDPMDEVGGL